MSKRAAEAMSGKLVHIGWNAPMLQAFELMEKNRMRHLPVTDGDGDIIGILSDRDVQRAMKSELRWDETLQAKVPVFEAVEFDPDAKVRHYMSWPVKSVEHTTDLRVVAAMMVTDKISSVLVTKGERYIGILTTEDLLKILMGLLGETPKARVIPVESLVGNYAGTLFQPGVYV